MLAEGDRMPAFELPDQNGRTVRSADLSGKKLVVYFYPRDDTPACTNEACSIRDSFPEFRAKGLVVIGISADTPASHEKFAAKFDLPFILLADQDKTVINAFGAWGEKKMYGRPYMGILRCTFLIGEDGIVQKVFPKVTPKKHAAEILKALSLHTAGR
jgi:thioredoxin-dependent peroxiredoxin